MANAAVEKLKSFSLHHGEKLIVGIAATLCVTFIAMAASKPSIELQPEQLSTAASNAESNLNQRQKEEDILAKLEESGLKNPGFLALVENQKANALKPEDFRARLEWVTPEPGAGLIRDQPELIAPVELAAYPGRGGILMYALDSNGERIVDEEATKNLGQVAMGDMGAMGPMGGQPTAKQLEEAKKKQEEEAKRRRSSLIGKIPSAKEKEEKEKQEALAAEVAAPQQKFKEETRGKRWVVITGVVDNKQLRDNWATALKIPATSAYPNYREVDLERQERLPDGEWSEWKLVSRDENYKVLDNIPEVDEELVPENRRLEALVDPLPFLRAGYWTAVHVAKLVPAEAREIPKVQPNMMGSGMMGPGMAGGMMGPGMAGGMMGPGMGSEAGMGMMGMDAMGMGMGGGPVEDTNYAKSEEPELMTRTLDFTVEPDMTYRYRARLVVVNPNKNHTDVNPGVDTEADVLKGPWSEPTDEVTVPADVSAYAQNPVSTNRRNDLVAFQIVRWDPETGQTVVKSDDAGPGEIVGELGTTQVPSSDGTGATSKNIDFNARRIVLDATGGRQLLPSIFPERNQFEVPAVALVVRPDGAVVVRRQSRDKADEVRVEMESNYRRAIEESTKKRDPNSMMGMGGSAAMP